jgi:predicted molibdopterin-dependent oxidoreductase YjgC
VRAFPLGDSLERPVQPEVSSDGGRTLTASWRRSDTVRRATSLTSSSCLTCGFLVEVAPEDAQSQENAGQRLRGLLVRLASDFAPSDGP